MRSSTSRFLAVTLLVLLVCLPLWTATPANERGLARVTLGKVKVSIDYGRPALRGRDPLRLIEPGEIWRLGADAPTTFESNAALDFDGVRVPKGQHDLLVRYLDKGLWTLVFSSKPAPDYGPSAKVAEVPVQLETSKDPDDRLTIRLEGHGEKGTLVISWGTLRLTSAFTVAR